MSRIVKITQPKKVIDIVYYKSVTVEYDGVEYQFDTEESDSGIRYFCAIDGDEMNEMDWNFDNEVARELCEKIFDAYNEGIVDEDIETEFDMDEL